jgi:hypothetical protein
MGYYYNYVRPCGICANAVFIVSKKRIFQHDELDRFCDYGWSDPKNPCEDFESMTTKEMDIRLQKLGELK